jgi:phage gp29-like protein
MATASVRDKWSTYPSAGLTPTKLARILREADAGETMRQVELYEEMEEKDAHLTSVLSTRKNAVLGLDWEIMPFSDDAADVKVAQFVDDVLNNLHNLEDNMLDLLDAIGKGFGVLEIIWTVDGKRAYPAQLNWVHQKRFRFGDLHELRLLTEDNQSTGIELPQHKFIVHRYKARSGYTNRAGLLRVCAWLYLFKNFGLKDWVRYAEVFGMPLRLGKYEQGASKEDKEALYKALVDLGSDAAGIISKATEIVFVEQKAGNAGENIFHSLAEYIDRQVSKAVLGQTLTSDVGSTGSYAASQTHNQVRQDLIEADCKALAETLRTQLVLPLVLFNFGPDAIDRLPWIKYHYEPPEDLKTTAEVYATLVERVGLPVAAEHVYDKFGIPEPTEGQTILVAPSRQMPQGFPPAPQAAMKSRLIAAKEGTPSLVSAQRALDSLADGATRQGAATLAATFAPLKRIIMEATDLEGLRDRLLAEYSHLNTSDLEDLIARAMFVADLLGRWSVDA